MMQEFKEYICDNICRYPCTCRNEEHLMEMCEECQVEEMLEGILGGAEHHFININLIQKKNEEKKQSNNGTHVSLWNG